MHLIKSYKHIFHAFFSRLYNSDRDEKKKKRSENKINNKI